MGHFSEIRGKIEELTKGFPFRISFISLQCKRNKQYRMGIVTQRSFMIAKESSMEGLFSQSDSQGWYVS